MTERGVRRVDIISIYSCRQTASPPPSKPTNSKHLTANFTNNPIKRTSLHQSTWHSEGKYLSFPFSLNQLSKYLDLSKMPSIHNPVPKPSRLPVIHSPRNPILLSTTPVGAYLSLDPFAPVLVFSSAANAIEFRRHAPTTYFKNGPSTHVYVRAPSGEFPLTIPPKG